MPNYAPKLPLQFDEKGGYAMLENLGSVVRQNLKMLVLTIPGERIMLPDFGAGVYQYFFEPMVPSLFRQIRGDIIKQVSEYMPFIQVQSIDFLTSDIDSSLSDSSVRIVIKYRVPSFNANDVLDFQVNYVQN